MLHECIDLQICIWFLFKIVVIGLFFIQLIVNENLANTKTHLEVTRHI